MLSESSSSKRAKFLWAALTATALVVVGVVMLGDDQINPLGRAQAIAVIENADVPMANLPDEAQLHTPEGWQVESDEPVEGAEEKDEEESNLEQDPLSEDEDIDSPLVVEEDENGQSYVPELEGNVIVKEKVEEGNDPVKKDFTIPECFGMQKCSYRKKCRQICKKNCKPYTIRVCKSKKFCRCFCKYQKNLKKAKRCVIYKRRQCKQAQRYRCQRNCKKFCKRVPRCYCCSFEHIERACRKLCKKISYKTKCGKCRCHRVKCRRWCTFVCNKYK